MHLISCMVECCLGFLYPKIDSKDNCIIMMGSGAYKTNGPVPAWLIKTCHKRGLKSSEIFECFKLGSCQCHLCDEDYFLRTVQEIRIHI